MREQLPFSTLRPAELEGSDRRHLPLAATMSLWFVLTLWMTPALATSQQAQRLPARSAADAPRQSAADLAAPVGCSNLLENSGFELGVSDFGPWVAGGFATVTEERAHSGYYGVWMGGYKSPSDKLYQAVTVPAGVNSVTLHYWWNMHSLDDGHTPYDYLHVDLQTADGQTLKPLAMLDNTYERDAWRESSFDLTGYAGESLRIHFRCSGNAQFVTSYFLDDIELEVCAGVATPTPTSVPRERSYLPLIWYGAPI